MPYQQLKSAWRIIRGFSVRHRTIVCCLSGGRWWCGPVWEPELHQSLCLLQWNHGKNQLLYFVWSPPYLLAFYLAVEVQRCTLSWEVGKELGEESWQRAWRRVGKAEVQVEVDADMVEEKLEEEARRRTRRTASRGGGGGGQALW